ncbi:MAG TPA: 4-hydroxyphenylacetate 3-hydroxylase N-terminal domain-containing protein [Acidimicrobiales bacterium]|nr:4-hydroxyphenylacetate 3-hydroxylase N-terminal domain-containing protein [Acidimicrobiales bacterium]
MTKSGQQYIEGLRDGRRVHIDGEVVGDVTRHPAFRGSVGSIAGMYDSVHDPANAELMTFPSPATGQPVNRSFMIPRSEEDLVSRRRALKRSSEATFGLMGRSPDHVAGFLSGFAGGCDVFAEGGKEFGENIVRFHERARDEDLYVTYVIVPPQIDRSKPAHAQADPFPYAGVKEERDGGIVIRGAQMLGTGSAISDYVFLSCIHPLQPGDEAYAISAAIPMGAPGVKVYSRRSYAEGATSVFDYPLSTRFDETDSLMVFDDVFVPWEEVFVYRNLEVLRAQWERTAGHVLGNNQAQIRSWTKLDFLCGVARRVAAMNGSDKAPPVKGAIGEIAALASTVAGLVLAQEHNCYVDHNGVAWPAPAECYANMALQSEIYPKCLTMIRDLCGGGLIQLPSAADDYANPDIAADLERYVQSPGYPSVERVKLLKLAWDLIGSEFAGRHLQYEMFYAGAPFLVKMKMFEKFDWGRADDLVDAALAGYDLGGPREPGARSAAGDSSGVLGRNFSEG